MKIALGCDHGGINLKEEIKKFLEENNYDYEDFGTYNNESVDYPDYGKKVALEVRDNDFDRGILVCGTGIGISLAANKVKGIRAAVVSDVFSAKMCRAHNNCQILSLGERVVGKGLALELVNAFLTTDFEGDRHKRRVDKLIEIEENNL
ncbi:MAG: ribose 5-phosphate isomerase B [Peptostreptococcaceae bacterium]|jgi:ribose 5-phosphate isomerase B|nr:ribose 5-phosphate isomerase B [Peptostreptococcaceae bacterium]